MFPAGWTCACGRARAAVAVGRQSLGVGSLVVARAYPIPTRVCLNQEPVGAKAEAAGGRGRWLWRPEELELGRAQAGLARPALLALRQLS